MHDDGGGGGGGGGGVAILPPLHSDSDDEGDGANFVNGDGDIRSDITTNTGGNQDGQRSPLQPVRKYGAHTFVTRQTAANKHFVPRSLSQPNTAARSESPRKRTSIISMDARNYYFREFDEVTELHVVRLGEVNLPASVRWLTKDGTSKAGADFIHAEGCLEFAPGERLKTVSVEILLDKEWEPDEIFYVNLYGASPNVDLGIAQAAVHIVDETTYPVGMTRSDASSGDGHVLRNMRYFFLERIRRRGVKVTITSWCYLFKAFFDVIINNLTLLQVYFAMKEMGKNYEGNGNVSDALMVYRDRLGIQVIAYVAVLLFANILRWFTDLEQLDKRGRSGTRQDLRVWLVQRFLQLSERSAKREPAAELGHMTTTLETHVEEATNQGWYQIFIMIEASFGLVFVAVLVVYLSFIHGARFMGLVAALPSVLCIPFALAVTQSRESQNTSLIRKRAESEANFTEFAFELFSNRRTIKMFGQEVRMTDSFKREYDVFYTEHRKQRKFELQTEWYVRGICAVGFYLLLLMGPVLVMTTNIEAGAYVVLVKAVRSIEKYIIILSRALIAMERGSIGLKHVREVLNLESSAESSCAHGKGRKNDSGIDENDRWMVDDALSITIALFTTLKTPEFRPFGGVMKFVKTQSTNLSAVASRIHRHNDSVVVPMNGAHEHNRQDHGQHLTRQKSYGREWTSSSPGAAAADRWLVDDLEVSLDTFDYIRFEDVTLELDRGEGDGTHKVIDSASMDIPLGGIYAVIGIFPQTGRGVGKGVFLELISAERKPTAGRVTMSPALHCLTLTAEQSATFFRGTIRDNLLFGHPEPDTVPDSVLCDLCHRLEMDFFVSRLEYIVQRGGRNLRLENRIKFVVARALLADPEVIMLHRLTTGQLDSKGSMAVMYTLRDWVNNDGLPNLPSANRWKSAPLGPSGRRLRTAMITERRSTDLLGEYGENMFDGTIHIGLGELGTTCDFSSRTTG